MQIEYDPDKAAENAARHGVSFSDAEGVFFDPLAISVEDPDAVGEARFVAIGQGRTGHLLVIVFTERDGVHRLISARRATRRERTGYES